MASALIAGAAGPAGAADAGGAAAYVIEDAARISRSLTGAPGDPARGAALFADAGATGCAGCHGQGDAPGLAALRAFAAEAGAGAVRLAIVAPEVRRPGSAMPGYFAAGQRLGAADPRYGGPRLTAAEIEDLVAFLAAAPAPDAGAAAGETPPD